MRKIQIVYEYGRYSVYVEDFLLFSALSSMEECYQKIAEHYYYKGSFVMAEFYV